VTTQERAPQPLSRPGEPPIADALARCALEDRGHSWSQPPTAVIVSSFLFAYVGPAVAMVWLVTTLAVQATAFWLRRKIAAGERNIHGPYFAVAVTSMLCWVVHALLLWHVGEIVPRIATLMDLFTAALSAVVGYPQSRKLMLGLAIPPLATLCVILIAYLATHTSPLFATMASLSTFGAAAMILTSGLAMHAADRKLSRANQELRLLSADAEASREFLAQVSDLAQVGGWQVDVSTGTVMLGGAARAIFELDADATPSLEDMMNLYGPDTQRRVREAFAKAPHDLSPWDLETSCTTAKGRPIWVKVIGRSQVDPTNTIRLIGAVQDITERVETHARLENLAEAAAQANAAKSNFLANMSHELRTPLNAIIGFSDLLRSEAFASKRHQYAELIHEAGQHLFALINDILDLAKIEAWQVRISDVRFDFRTLATECLQLMTARAEENRITLVLACDNTLPDIVADSRAIKQILLNLMSNALRFTSAGGRVEIFAATCADGEFLFGVNDTGVGIESEDLARVFDKFGQGRHDALSGERGTGLGLPIVRGLVAAHGGRLTLDSVVNRGTRVSIYLPTTRVAAEPSRLAG
jgi:signal transduction histidine kinase